MFQNYSSEVQLHIYDLLPSFIKYCDELRILKSLQLEQIPKTISRIPKWSSRLHRDPLLGSTIV